MKGTIVVNEIPKSCVSCDFFDYDKEECRYICWADYNGLHDLNKYKMRDLENKKPDWCPIKKIDAIE